jgi:Holliday junction resolvasome RuvABC endonuclease subunit
LKLLGFDPGRANTGLAALDTDTRDIGFKTISIPIYKARRMSPINPTSYRLFSLHKELKKWISAYTTQKGHILAIVEDYAYGDQKMTLENFRTMDKMSLEVGEAHGVIYQTLFSYGIPMIKVAPSQMKYFITGNGRCEKTEIIKRMHAQYGVPMEDDHQYDALALVHIGRYFVLFCKDQKAIPVGSYEYNVITGLAYQEKYAPIAQMFGLNL